MYRYYTNSKGPFGLFKWVGLAFGFGIGFGFDIGLEERNYIF